MDPPEVKRLETTRLHVSVQRMRPVVQHQLLQRCRQRPQLVRVKALRGPCDTQMQQRGGQHSRPEGLIEAVAELQEGEGRGRAARLDELVVVVVELQHAEARGQQTRGQWTAETANAAGKQGKRVRSTRRQGSDRHACCYASPCSRGDRGDGLSVSRAGGVGRHHEAD